MRYVIIEKTDGLFLGSYLGEFIFAKDNTFPIVKVPSFESIQLAEFYIASYFPIDNKQYGVIEIDTKDKYVSLIDILKAGYEEYTHRLMMNYPMISTAMH